MHAQTGSEDPHGHEKKFVYQTVGWQYILPIGPIFLLDISVNIETIWEQQINTIQ